jgi:hypothetical protein
MCAEASAVLRAVVADFSYNCWYLEIPSDSRIRTYQNVSTIIRKAFDWKHSTIYMLKLEAAPLSCIPFKSRIDLNDT